MLDAKRAGTERSGRRRRSTGSAPVRRPSQPRSARGPAAIDDERVASDVARRFGGQEEERSVELVRSPGPTERRALVDELPTRLARQALGRRLRSKPSGRKRVDADSA